MTTTQNPYSTPVQAPATPSIQAPGGAAKRPFLERFLTNCLPVGGIFRLDYDTALVSTDDLRKREVGGLPRGSLLLAAAVTRGPDQTLSLDEQEVILLRVRGIGELPNERALMESRESVVSEGYNRGHAYGDVTDPMTQAMHQRGAIDCDVLGTFYADPLSGGATRFGADVDNVYSSTLYEVFRPSEKALSWIASYTPDADAQRLPLGTVRYASTRRKQVESGLSQAMVNVNVSDFVGRKTAVFGMTRTGKSNTIKTLVTAVHRYASETHQKIGQVIFDPQGEYAKINAQDGTGLRLLGDADGVSIYTTQPTAGDAQEKALRLNFYDVDLFPVIWDMACDTMRNQETSYTKRFMAADMEDPDPGDFSALTHWNRGRLAFYGLLAKAGYKGGFYSADGTPTSLPFSLKDDTASKFTAETNVTLQGGSGKYAVSSPQEAAAVTEFIGKLLGRLEKARKGSKDEDREEAQELENLVGKWEESEQFAAVNEVFHHVRGRGLAGLRELREFHDPNGTGDLAVMVWDDMMAGRLAVIDLSVGSEVVIKTMSERLVTALVNKASDRFRSGAAPVPFQIVVEEAHNLFERGRTVAADPWVRMSKEAAKYKIGLVYATQEVTGVDRQILSNTSNWVVAHLNSGNETHELGRYYDFSSFADRLRKTEDVGSVVLKTYSSPYLVPMQVAKFDHDMINDAREAAGLQPVDSTGRVAERVAPGHIHAASPTAPRAPEAVAAPAADWIGNGPAIPDSDF